MKHRKAFTLIELLIVIAIIGILIAAIAVAVTKAKEFAVRSSCGQHMSQLGLALRTYEAQIGAFPVTVSPGGSTPARSGLVPLLGYLEQKHIGDRFKPNLAWYQAPAEAYAAPIPVLMCPAAPQPNTGVRLDTSVETSNSGKTIYTTSPRACADYGAASGASPAFLNYDATIPPEEAQNQTGAMAADASGFRRAVAIPDGLGTTIFYVEDAARPDLWENGRFKKKDVLAGAGWASHRSYFDINGKDPLNASKPGPCLMNCSNDNEIYSFHNGGCNFLFGDRSVRFMSVGVAPKTLAFAISREGNHPFDW